VARRLSFSPLRPSDQGVGRAGRGSVDAFESVVLFARFRHHDFVKVWRGDGDNGVVGSLLAEGVLTCAVLPGARLSLFPRWSRSARPQAQVVAFVDRVGFERVEVLVRAFHLRTSAVTLSAHEP
jgi:hypothetical protein